MIAIKILVLNVGSSSLKYRFIDMEDNENCLIHGHVDGIGLDRCTTKIVAGDEVEEEERIIKTHKEAVKFALKSLLNKNIIKSYKDINAIGHRVVHGGDYFKDAAPINNSNLSYIKIFSEFAPLHNPPQVNAIVACKSYIPDVKQIAVFDTAFHQTMPPEAHMYALPLEFYKKHKLRKYGFHGTSHKYVSNEAASKLRKKHTKIVTCHLGNGSSICAVKDGESVDTSMGFTPNDGLIMGTRVGMMDPMVPLFIMKKLKLKPDEVDKILTHESGFLGTTQMVSDLRDVHGLAIKDNPKAVVAQNMLVHRIKHYIGAYSAIMGGIDAIVFTGGIGENAEYIRADVCADLAYLGVKLDSRKNKKGEVDISSEKSTVKVFVIPTNEELQIARETISKINQLKGKR